MTERQGPNEQPANSASEESGVSEDNGDATSFEDVTDLGELRTPEVEKKREDIRALLAGSLTTLFIVVVIALFMSAVFGGSQWARVQEFSQIAFGVVGGIVGTIVGFYFGSQR
jgi:hypothetical protein